MTYVQSAIAMPVVTLIPGESPWWCFGMPYFRISSSAGIELGEHDVIPHLLTADAASGLVAIPKFIPNDGGFFELAGHGQNGAALRRFRDPGSVAMEAVLPSFPNAGHLRLGQPGRIFGKGELSSMLYGRNHSRYEIQDLLLERFVHGVTLLYWHSLTMLGQRYSLQFSDSPDGHYLQASGVIASAAGSPRSRKRTYSDSGGNRGCDHGNAQLDLMELAAMQRVVAVPTGYPDDSSQEVIDAALDDGMNLHPLTFRTGENPQGGFVLSTNDSSITLAILVGGEEQVMTAFREMIPAFAAQGVPSSRVWRDYLDKAVAAPE